MNFTRGIFTSELWLTVLGMVLSFLTVLSTNAQLEQTPELKAVLVAFIGFVTSIYAWGRSKVKASNLPVSAPLG